MTHYDLLVHRDSSFAEQGLIIKPKETKSKEKVTKDDLQEEKTESSQTEDSDIDEEDEHIHCIKGCPISKANTLEEEYFELKLAHDQIKDKFHKERQEREEEDKKMKGKITAAKFRAEIKLLKSSYTAAVEAVAEQTTKKEEALTMVKLLKSTEKAKQDLQEVEGSPIVEEISEKQEQAWTEVCRSKEKSMRKVRTFNCEECDETSSTEKTSKQA